MEEKHFMSYLAISRVIPGLILIFLLAAIARYVTEPFISKIALFGVDEFFLKVLKLNFLLQAFLLGVIIRNVFGIPKWAEAGVEIGKSLAKFAVVLLGALYTIETLIILGIIASAVAALFIMLTLGIVMFFGRNVWRINDRMQYILSSACGICGVSAAMVTASLVGGRVREFVRASAIVLSFGFITLLISPILGAALNLSSMEYGIWVATGILNSGQVIAAAMIYDPAVAPGEPVYYASLWNIVRVMAIPTVALTWRLFYMKKFPEKVKTGYRRRYAVIIIRGIPYYLLPFLALAILNTLGVFGEWQSPTHAAMVIQETTIWSIAVGMVAMGMGIDLRIFKELKGNEFKVGYSTAIVKYVVALVFAIALIAVAGEIIGVSPAAWERHGFY